MAPTIRDRIKRRFRWPQALMTGGMLVLILLQLSAMARSRTAGIESQMESDALVAAGA
jgi:hypothetical protein